MFYFLNTFFDVRDTPTAVGALRDLQLCDVMLIKIFDKVCKNNNIPYWLDYGTLLGAYRHGGFIPWDDDLDVAMRREDYDRALPILKSVLEPLGLEADEKPGAPMVRIGIGYKHEKTGVWLDVFPVDEIQTNSVRDQIYPQICEKMLRYRKYYFKYRNKVSVEELCKKKEEIINFSNGNYTVLYHGPEYLDVSLYVHDYEDVFPLKTISFEELELKVPNKCDVYLKRVYGKDYMNFPRNGVEHHGGEDNKLAMWAEKSGTDMNEILLELENIYMRV